MLARYFLLALKAASLSLIAIGSSTYIMYSLIHTLVLQVTLNAHLLAGLKYSEATPTFHQWRDLRHTIHGLNFSTKDDAVNFSKTMNAVLQVLRNQKETGLLTVLCMTYTS